MPAIALALLGLLMCFFPSFHSSDTRDNIVINVEDYGATGDGITDDTMAFQKAWKVTCSSNGSASLVVPSYNTYLLRPIVFSGPCKSQVSAMIKGVIEASANMSDWSSKNQRTWILFSRVDYLRVEGGGTINGNGHVWWRNSCKVDKSQPCKDAPTALTFRLCNDLTVKNLYLKDSQQIHMKFETCSNVTVSTIKIEAPKESPNTDGIHISETKNIELNYCNIGTGDDCISIVSGSQGVKATNIVCGPGHGISIGSLGQKNAKAQVSDVIVDKAQLLGTTNGVRIKTWQGGKGYAENIIFQNIDMVGVKNPIIIDQNYCDRRKNCKPQISAVQVSNVQYINIKGTSSSKYAINFNCSESYPCSGIVLRDINLVSDDGAEDVESFCQNAICRTEGTVIPQPCEQNFIDIQYGLQKYFDHFVALQIN